MQECVDRGLTRRYATKEIQVERRVPICMKTFEKQELDSQAFLDYASICAIAVMKKMLI